MKGGIKILRESQGLRHAGVYVAAEKTVPHGVHGMNLEGQVKQGKIKY